MSTFGHDLYFYAKHNSMKAIITGLLLLCAFSTFAQTQKTKNIVVVLLDGYRWKEIFQGADSVELFNKKYMPQDSALLQQYWGTDTYSRREKLMPFVWTKIAKDGQLYGNRDLGNFVNVRNKYWFSYPGRSESFCGYYDSLVNSNSYPDNPNENVFEFINQQKAYNKKVVTFASWDAVARILNRDRNGMLVNIYGEDVKGPRLTETQQQANVLQHYSPDVFGAGERLDVMTYAMTTAYIKANHPRVVYMDFGDTDDWGHAGKYDMYLDAAHKSDAMIRDLWNSLQQDPFYKDQTAILICCDHGRGYGDEWTDHGSNTAHSNETYLMAMGPDIPARGEVKTSGQIYQDQYAQTIAHLLGFDFTANHPIGQPINSLTKPIGQPINGVTK